MKYRVLETYVFRRWYESLRDLDAQMRIAMRIRRISIGNLGDTKAIGEGVLEARVPCGPGYRIYLKRHDQDLIILLAGGDKSTQHRDIRRAQDLAREL